MGAFGGENLRYNIGNRDALRGSILVEHVHAYVYGSFYRPIISAEGAFSIIGKTDPWHAFQSSAISSMSFDECHFCGVQITGLWIYTGRDYSIQGGPSRIYGIRFEIGQTPVRREQVSWQKEAVLHGCLIDDSRKLCIEMQEFWSAPHGEHIVSVDAHQDAESLTITGFVLRASGGSSSQLLGTSSPSAIVVSSSFEGGL